MSDAHTKSAGFPTSFVGGLVVGLVLGGILGAVLPPFFEGGARVPTPNNQGLTAPSGPRDAFDERSTPPADPDPEIDPQDDNAELPPIDDSDQ